MGIESVNQQGNFLNEEQKKVKQKIMEDMIEAFLGNISKNQKLFPDIQSVLDLSFSILVMFNRDMLTHIISTFHLEAHRKQLMKDLFEQIKDQVNKNIKNTMM